MDRTTLKKKLSEGVVTVTFLKKENGEKRVMKCTLDGSRIPEEKHPQGTAKFSMPDDIFPVWDVEKNGWRSFDYNSVTSVEC